MAGIGAVLGLASYGVVKLLDNSQFQETPMQLFERMEEKVVQNDYYFEALIELSGDDLNAKFTNLEIDDELQQLKAKSHDKLPENEEKISAVNPPYKEVRQCVKTLKGHKSNVNDVAIHPDNKTLVSGSDDRQVNLWNLLTGKLLYTFSGQAEAVLSVAISPDGKQLISGSVDRKISKWQSSVYFHCTAIYYICNFV
ncbi:hypothetical protein [Aphanizomenon flos-aquae]|uniref:hypothetical protein n=1 Tax=Aphanizomenon flos-aquae TaxID=1176 RepID=UPI00068993FC|nr:hypothetical protein [Aphanizomenon flos-aquae]